MDPVSPPFGQTMVTDDMIRQSQFNNMMNGFQTGAYVPPGSGNAGMAFPTMQPPQTPMPPQNFMPPMPAMPSQNPMMQFFQTQPGRNQGKIDQDFFHGRGRFMRDLRQNPEMAFPSMPMPYPGGPGFGGPNSGGGPMPLPTMGGGTGNPLYPSPSQIGSAVYPQGPQPSPMGGNLGQFNPPQGRDRMGGGIGSIMNPMYRKDSGAGGFGGGGVM